MQIYENETTEFKREWTESAKKTICAFANSYGGTIYFGVRDDGLPEGIPDEETDRLIRTITDVARHAMVPSADDLVRCIRSQTDGKNVLEVRVAAGSQTPYAVKVKDEGTRVYIRRGAACYEASEQEQRQLYQMSNPLAFEERPARLQALTFRETEDYFQRKNLEFSEQKMVILGMKTPDNRFTNLAYWLSDQCEVETRLGFYSGEDKASAAEELLVYRGSLLKQYESVLGNIYNRFGAAFQVGAFEQVDVSQGGERQESESYPTDAVREALINAFAHRDYSVLAPSFVSVHPARMEIFTYGGLPQPLVVEDLREGVSFCRNNKLASLFMRLKLMEGYGMGFPKIYAAYVKEGIEPQVRATPRWMKVTLPRVAPALNSVSELGMQIVRHLKLNGPTSRTILQQKVAGGSYSRVIAELKSLQDKGIVHKRGSGPKVLYAISGSK